MCAVFPFLGLFPILTRNAVYAVSFLATLNTRRVVQGRGTDDSEKAETSIRRATTARSREQEEVETNMFHLGTRMPTLHEHDVDQAYPAYPAYDIKPGFPAPTAAPR